MLLFAFLHWIIVGALVIYILACFGENTFCPMRGKGTRVVHGKLWKIINYTEKYCSCYCNETKLRCYSQYVLE